MISILENGHDDGSAKFGCSHTSPRWITGATHDDIISDDADIMALEARQIAAQL